MFIVIRTEMNDDPCDPNGEASIVHNTAHVCNDTREVAAVIRGTRPEQDWEVFEQTPKGCISRSVVMLRDGNFLYDVDVQR